VKAWDGTNKRVHLAVVYPAARRMVRSIVHTALSAPVTHKHSHVASHAHCRRLWCLSAPVTHKHSHVASHAHCRRLWCRAHEQIYEVRFNRANDCRFVTRNIKSRTSIRVATLQASMHGNWN
jgi:hypothetical protein